ncbi:MAG: hypothetical protein K0U86_21510 [Planctomycetes bacterium]|nr:hypothetical protein [Planctomycetota bacterium]MCH9727484.1 hypothetical protein [Planctomycetota bacterium]MCH9775989.1 hypothetical protein [Planctomycetota bacterium]MCH9789482.1 hypothetical protein [Planctomycetota bacterium]
MLCWRTLCILFFSIILLPGSLRFAHAQPVVREINQPQNQLQRTAVIGLLGEFVHCAAYEVKNPQHDLGKLISRAHGFTSKSSGIIRVVRGGRISQDLLYSPNTNFSLMHGDVLIALKSPTNVINISSGDQSNGFRGNQFQAPPELVQLAILNLLDRPVVFGVPPEIANLAGILHSLRQPLEKFPEIAQSIKVIPPQRIRSNPELKTNKLTAKLASGTVLVLSSHKSFDLSLVPHSLPTPLRLQSALSSIPESHLETTPNKTKNTHRSLQRVTHPENISLPEEMRPLKNEKDTLQLNGPLLQQTAASLPLVPQSRNSPSEHKTHKSDFESESQKQNTSVSTTVPNIELKAAPAPPTETVQILDDTDLSTIEETENASTSFLPQWSYYLFLAVIAGVVWKLLSRRSQTGRRSDKNHLKPHSMSPSFFKSEDHTTKITDWNSLPPMPKKSLLEQILENKIPVIEETPQIPSQTYIYGRHQSKSVRVDQQGTLKGPHFSGRTNRETSVPQVQEATNSAPLPLTPMQTDKNLKAPAFRFDRSHPESSKSSEGNPTLSKTARPASSKKAEAVLSETSVNSGILDRVLQAVQGVMPK